MLSVKTNTLVLKGQQNHSKAQSGQETAMERLSSGKRVNSAKDDAAGQAIGNRMTSQINGYHQAIRNSNDGISLLRNTQASLDSINNNLQRIRELTVQGLNGTLNDKDRISIGNEIAVNIDEIKDTISKAKFNNIPLLKEGSNPIKIQTGANTNNNIEINTSFSFDFEKLEDVVSHLKELGIDTKDGLVEQIEEIGNEEISELTDTPNPIQINLDDPGITFKLDGEAVSDSSSYKMVESNGENYIIKDVIRGDFKIHKISDYEANHYTETGETGIDISIEEETYSGVSSYTNDYGLGPIRYGNLDGLVVTGDNKEPFYNDSGIYYSNEDENGDITYYKTRSEFTKREDGVIYSVLVAEEGPFTIDELDPLEPMVNMAPFDFTNTPNAKAFTDSGLIDIDNIIEKEDGSILAQVEDSSTDTSFSFLPVVGVTYKMEPDLTPKTFNFTTTDIGKETFTYSEIDTIIANEITEDDPVEETEPPVIDDEDYIAFLPLEEIDRLIQVVDTKRGMLGSVENRLDSNIQNLEVIGQNLTEARSRILDADYAVETSKLTKSQIIQQASTSMLVQANQNPDIVLSLLEQV